MRAGDDGRAERAAFRAWVRDHHPDRGGDPQAFAAELRRRRGRERVRGTALPGAPIVGVQRRYGPVEAVRRWRYRRDRARRLR